MLVRGAGKGADERGSDPADRADVERRRAGAATHAVCSKESVWHRNVNQGSFVSRGSCEGGRYLLILLILTLTAAGTVRTTR